MLKKLFVQAQELQNVLKALNVPFTFVGGLANAIHGIPRTTLDADVLVLISEKEITSFIEKLATQVKLLPADPLDFARRTKIIPIEFKGMLRADLIVAGLKFESNVIKRAFDLTVEGEVKLKVCTPEDLLIMKLISSRNKDRDDVKGIISRQTNKLDLDYVRNWLNKFEQGLDRSDLISDLDSLIRANS